MKTQTIKKYRHHVRIQDRYFLPVKNKDFVLKGSQEGPGLDYDFGNIDNKDWNKWAGCAFDLYQPHGQTVMVVWRSKVTTPENEWTLYYHNIIEGDWNYKEVGSVPGLVNEEKMLTLPHGEVPTWFCEFDVNNQVHSTLFSNYNQVLNDVVQFKDIGNYHTRINSYHGGNRSAVGKIKNRKDYRGLLV